MTAMIQKSKFRLIFGILSQVNVVVDTETSIQRTDLFVVVANLIFAANFAFFI